jgi:hypothetical protein
MLEKLGAVVVIVASFVGLYGIKMLNLPIFITIPLVFAGVIICLVGIVFLFSEGPIFTATRQVKTAPQVGKALKETAS